MESFRRDPKVDYKPLTVFLECVVPGRAGHANAMGSLQKAKLIGGRQLDLPVSAGTQLAQQELEFSIFHHG